MQTTTQIQKRINLEKRIVRQLVRALLRAGYELSVDYNEGEGRVITWTRDYREVVDALFACDEEWLETQIDSDETETGFKRSFVRLVYGNDGYDVIADYGISLEPVLAPINAWTDELQCF